MSLYLHIRYFAKMVICIIIYPVALIKSVLVIMINFKLKLLNSDFKVKEVSFLPPLKEKSVSGYTYLLVQKDGLTTFDLIEKIRNYFKLDFSDIAAEGLKDEDGITEQLISVKFIFNETDISKFNSYLGQKNGKTRISQIAGFGEESIEPGVLFGNIFEIAVRNLTKTQAKKIIYRCQNNKYFSFINYYDAQRFGTPGSIYNTHLIGKAIIGNDWKKAYSEFTKSGNLDLVNINLDSANLDNNNFKKLMTEAINPQKICFFISSYNSYLWNKKASTVIKNYGGTAYLDSNIVGKLATFKKDCFACPNSLSIAAYEYDKERQSVKKKTKTRSLVVNTTIIPFKIFADELNKNRSKIILSFFLPIGSYATMVIKQLICSIFP